MTDRQYWLETLGCPKNQVDSEKLAGVLGAEGYRPAPGPGQADLVVVNTCAFIEAARQESVDAVLTLAEARRPGARLVLTGCMAERYGSELAEALPEVDLVAGFGVSLTDQPGEAPGRSAPVALGPRRRTGAARPGAPARQPGPPEPSFDLLSLPRPPAGAPWAYVKVAEGCDRRCGFCAIPSFRGSQRSRPVADVLAEVGALAAGASGGGGVREVVLVAQDLASFGRDRAVSPGSGVHRAAGRPAPGGGVDEAHEGSPIVSLTRAVSTMVPRTRLLYLYPSQLTDSLVQAVLDTGVPYFDLSLQHVSRPHLARMRRWGDGERFLRRMEEIRAIEPSATFRSSFILGYPGETEEDHDLLLEFLHRARLDWAGFFTFSPEEGTHAAGLDDQVPAPLALQRLGECSELQDAITAERRDLLVGQRLNVLVDAPGRARSVHEAPEIDGLITVPDSLAVGSLVDVDVVGSLGTDLVAEPVGAGAGSSARLLPGAPLGASGPVR